MGEEEKKLFYFKAAKEEDVTSDSVMEILVFCIKQKIEFVPCLTASQKKYILASCHERSVEKIRTQFPWIIEVTPYEEWILFAPVVEF